MAGNFPENDSHADRKTESFWSFFVFNGASANVARLCQTSYISTLRNTSALFNRLLFSSAFSHYCYIDFLNISFCIWKKLMRYIFESVINHRSGALRSKSIPYTILHDCLVRVIETRPPWTWSFAAVLP